MEKKKTSKAFSIFLKVIVAIIGSALCCVVLWVFPRWAGCILFTIVTTLAGFEFAVPTGFVKSKYLTALVLVQAAAVPWAVYFELPIELWALWMFAALTLSFLPEVLFENGPDVREIVVSMFSAFAFPSVLSLFVVLQRMEHGNIFVLAPLVAAWSCDALALIVGMLCGKHKLLPRVSPNKTVEGFFGGICGGVLGMVVYALFLKHNGAAVSLPLFAVLGGVGALFGVFGDLVLSLVKRSCGIKDFSRLLPEHGGVLDRFDSVLFVLPLFYAAFRWIGI